MSGILGIYNLNGRPLDRERLEGMMAVLSHRGRNGAAYWGEGSAGVGHLQLHTTPESLYEQLPLVNASPHLVLTADARIDNRDDLICALELPKYRQHPITDSELILAAYKKWGTASPKRLLGAFAFAIWDSREQFLFCARDHFGVKPFYYHYAPGRLFAFASEKKALLQLEAVPKTLNEVMIAEHLMVPMRDDPARTFYQEISSLSPAHSLVVGPDNWTPQHYWQPDPNVELRLPSDEAYAEAFRELFQEAVRCRLRSAFPVGTMLSGGLDSSSVTCTAAELIEQGHGSGGQLSTYSAVFPTLPACDERSFINAVLNKYELVPHLLNADEKSPLEDLEQVLSTIDQPKTGGNHYINWNLYRKASTDDVRIILDGFDGDTTVSHGTCYFRELKLARRWLTLAKEVKAFSDRTGQPWAPALWSWLRAPVLSTTGLVHLLRAGRALSRLLHERSLYSPVVPPGWRNVVETKFARRIEAYTQETSERAQSEREHHYSRLMRPLMGRVNEVLDATAATFSLEVRFPFWDKRLVEFCLSLPPEQKMHNGWSRMVMRRGMKDILPEAVRWRGGKSDLGPSFDRGLIAFEREKIENVLGDSTGIEQYVKPEFLQDVCPRYLTRGTTAEEDLYLWRALTLALWLQHLHPPHSRSLALATEVMPGTDSLKRVSV